MAVINLISGPRNISTALMYSFGQREDTTVLDEPFYAIYLDRSGAKHPGRDEVLAAQLRDEQVVKNHIQRIQTPVVFVKNMAHHMEVLADPFIAGSVNVFLIRNPFQIIASYAQVIESPVMRDIGLECQWQFFEQLRKTNQKVVVVDSSEIVSSPSVVLKKVCKACGIVFDEAMLSWQAGPKPYDGIWAKYWYGNVHRSTGFERQTTSSRPLPASLEDLYKQAKEYYERLLPFSLSA